MTFIPWIPLAKAFQIFLFCAQIIITFKGIKVIYETLQ